MRAFDIAKVLCLVPAAVAALPAGLTESREAVAHNRLSKDAVEVEVVDKGNHLWKDSEVIDVVDKGNHLWKDSETVDVVDKGNHLW